MKNILVYLSFLAFLALSSCTPENIDSAKEGLLKAIPSQHKTLDFNFKTTISDAGTTTVLKNKAVGPQLILGTGDTTVLLGYYAERKTGTTDTKMYRSQLIRKDSLVFVEITDLEGKLVEKREFPVPQQVLKAPPPGGHDSIDDCLDELFCQFEELRCEANKDCETKYYAIICCLNDGLCYSIHFIFPPTDFRCLFRPSPLDPPIVVAQR